VQNQQPVIYALIIFCLVLGTYNFHRLIKSSGINNPSVWLTWVNANRRGLWILSMVSLLNGVGGLLIFVPSGIEIWIGTGLIAVVSVWYVLPVVKKPLRDVPYIKTILIAVVWSFMLIYVPMGGIVENKMWPSLTGFLFIYGITVPFDIRDLKYDEVEKRTLPMVIGMRSSKILSLVFVTVFYVYIAKINVNILESLLFVGSYLIYVGLILGITPRSDDRWCVALDANLIPLGMAFYLSEIQL
jgi:hypothetical protein